MNTPDTEWEKEFTEWACDYMGSKYPEEASKARKDLTVLITQLRSSRDTYWKERVGKEVEALISEGISLADDRECSRIITESDGSERTNMHYILDYKIKKHNQALDTLLDNLK